MPFGYKPEAWEKLTPGRKAAAKKHYENTKGNVKGGSPIRKEKAKPKPKPKKGAPAKKPAKKQKPAETPKSQRKYGDHLKPRDPDAYGY